MFVVRCTGIALEITHKAEYVYKLNPAYIYIHKKK